MRFTRTGAGALLSALLVAATAATPAVAAASSVSAPAVVSIQASSEGVLRLTGCSATIEWQDRTLQVDRFRIVASCTGTSTDLRGTVPGWTGWKQVSYKAGFQKFEGGCTDLGVETEFITPQNLTVVSKWKQYYADDDERARMVACPAAFSY